MNACCSSMPFFGNLILTKPFNQASVEEKFNTLYFLLKRTLEGIEAFEEKKFKQFDALVGDQACQIRALKIVLLSQNKTKFEKSFFLFCLNKMDKLRADNLRDLEDLESANRNLNNTNKVRIKEDPSLKEALEKLFQEKIQSSNKRRNELKKEFTQKCESRIKKILKNDPKVTPDFLFLMRAYFLTISAEKSGESKYPNSINPNKFGIPNIKPGRLLSSELFSEMQLALSLQSARFAEELALESSFSYKNSLEIRLIEKKVLGKPKRRYELPFLYMTEVIFSKALEDKIPLILKIRNYSQNEFAFRKIFSEKEDDQAPALVIEAFCSDEQDLKSDSFRYKIIKDKLLKQIKMNAAQHPQYTDGVEDKSDENLIRLRTRALTKGFSENNNSVYCITHVFADLISNQMSIQVEEKL